MASQFWKMGAKEMGNGETAGKWVAVGTATARGIWDRLTALRYREQGNDSGREAVPLIRMCFPVEINCEAISLQRSAVQLAES